MADTVIKVLTIETTCNTTANSFGNANLVRLVNSGNSNVLITRAGNTGNVGSFTMVPAEVVICEKFWTDTLVSSNATTILATAVGYKN